METTIRHEMKDIEGRWPTWIKCWNKSPCSDSLQQSYIRAQVGDISALDDYSGVLAINPNNVLAYFNRAAVFMKWAVTGMQWMTTRKPSTFIPILRKLI